MIWGKADDDCRVFFVNNFTQKWRNDKMTRPASGTNEEMIRPEWQLRNVSNKIAAKTASRCLALIWAINQECGSSSLTQTVLGNDDYPQTMVLQNRWRRGRRNLYLSALAGLSIVRPPCLPLSTILSLHCWGIKACVYISAPHNVKSSSWS